MQLKNSNKINEKTKEKYNKLQEILLDMKKVLIAFSGGVDSSFLLKVALDTLGKENVMAVIADSPIRFTDKLDEAQKIAQNIGINPLIIETSELSKENFKKNDKYRCYYCKYELYQRLKEIAKSKGIKYVLDGTNADDLLNENRPGIKAVEELDVKTPLQKAGLKKEEIRKLSKVLDLETWNQSSDTCLATRFSYNMKINKDDLNRLEKVENYLREFSFKQLRARIHDDNTIRIEVLPSEMEKIMNKKEEIVNKIKKEGFYYITLDLEGYRTGSTEEANKN
ncbi:MAG: ATP-dependent sacrificial sulfur transferase LarE [Bacillota bacterium]